MLFRSPIDKAVGHLTTSLVPARKFLPSNSVVILSIVDASNQDRSSHAISAAADIVGPGYKGTVLIVVQAPGK